jgi:hypothetical protein
MKSGRGIAGILLILLLSILETPSEAAVSSSPSINLDGALTSSLATSSPTRWNDLSTGTLQFTIGANSAYNSFGGGSLTHTSAGTSGAYLAPSAIGTASNPSGDISVFTWVYFTSWNVDWNILGSRWFSNFGGTGSASDFHFAVRTKGLNHRLNLYTTSTSDIDGSTNLSLNKWYQLGFTLGSGVPKFYVNGKYDTPTVTSGVTRTAITTPYLFVGDYRTSCAGCSFNGYMSKFRMWNSVLASSTVLSDFQSEASTLGYSTTTALSLSNNTPKYRTSNVITATVTAPGRVTFYEKGKLIPRCKNVTVASTTGSCTWKPVTHGVTNISASFTPTDSDYASSSAIQSFTIPIRSATR